MTCFKYEDKEMVYSYQLKSGSDFKRLDIYEDHIHFVSEKEEDIFLKFEEISRATISSGVFYFYPIEQKAPICINGLPQGMLKELQPYIEERMSIAWKSIKPELWFEKNFGMDDKIAVNEDYGTFCIKYANGKQTSIYYLKDIINYEIKELIGGGNTHLEEQMKSDKSDVAEVHCRIKVKNERGSFILLAKIANPLFAVSRNSTRYSIIKAEETKLETYLKAIVEKNVKEEQL